MLKNLIAILVLLASMLTLAACVGDGKSIATLKVGMAYDSGGRGDGSFNDAAYAGLAKAQQELGAEIMEITAEASDTNNERREHLRLLASSGYNPVIAAGFGYSAAIDDIAKEFPGTTFAIIDAEVAGPNVVSLIFAAEQGSYLVGVIAASASKTGKIGFIGGMDIPLINAFRAGYVQGAKSINPNITIEIAYIGASGDATAWNSPEKAKSATEVMIANHVDVGYAAAGASNAGMFQAFEAAGGVGNGLWGIGADSDQYNVPSLADVKNVILTSMLKRVDVAVFEVIEGVASGSPLVGVQNFDLKRGGVGYASSNPAVGPYQAAADAAAAGIVNGEIIVLTQ
ncbi:BMP family protein [Desulfurivibrio sp. C05AmB]|uniref:BMP family lipoprotein n=1 Tax=Desulfurivibrio sp. C05AmB TaxID=3374371 RepID=UPI00376F1A8B